MVQFEPAEHQLCQASDHLVRCWWSHGEGAVEFYLFLLLFHPYLRKWRHSPPEWRAERKAVLRGKILVVFIIFQSSFNSFVPHPDCQLQTPPNLWMWHFSHWVRTVRTTPPAQLHSSWQSLFQPKAQGRRAGWQLKWIQGENSTSKGFLPQTVSVLRS